MVIIVISKKVEKTNKYISKIVYFIYIWNRMLSALSLNMAWIFLKSNWQAGNMQTEQNWSDIKEIY